MTMDQARTIGAEFSIDTFAVTFNAGAHGTLSGEAEQTIDYGSTAEVPSVTPAIGYDFTGWSGDASAAIVSNTVFTAQYSAIWYAITYSDPKDAPNSNPETYTIEDEIEFAAPGDVYGWVFTGWSPASIALGSTGDVAVTSNWERAKFDVTVNGETTQYDYEEEVTFTAPATWEANGMQVVTFGTTFTAPVVTNEFTVTVTNGIDFAWDVCTTNWWFETTNTVKGSITAPEKGWMPDGTNFVLTAESDEHYHLTGWTGDTEGCVETNGTNLVVTMDRARTIGATFALIPYAITYKNLKGAANPNPASYTFDDSVTFAVPGEVHGWIFKGWSPESIAEGSTGAVEVEATWERAKFDVTVNGETAQYDYESEVTFSTSDVWDTNGMQVVTIGTTFTAPVVTNEFTVTVTDGIDFAWDIFATNWWFETSGTENGSITAPDAGWRPDGETFTLEAVPAERYHLTGWTGDVEGCVEMNGTELVVTMDRARTIGAEFAINTYTVVFDANGGTGVMTAQAFVCDEEQHLNECAFSRPDCEFRGWSLSADSDDIAYFDGENVVNLTDVANGSVTLYAVWEYAPARIPVPNPAQENVPSQMRGRTTLWTPVASRDTASGGDAVFTGKVAETYDGYIQDSNGKVLGTIQLKAAKAKKVSSKIAVTIQLAAVKKKQVVKGSLDMKTGRFEGVDSSGRMLSLLVGENSLSGTYGPYFIDGVQNKFKTKKSSSKAFGAAVLAKRRGTWSVAWPDVDGWSGASLSVAAKGKVKISCVLANGTKVSTSSQLLVGEDGDCAIPVVVTKKTQLTFNVWLSDTGVEVVGLDGAIAGKVGSLKSGAAVRLDTVALSSILGQTALPYLPDGVAVAQNGSKWVVASGAKAGKVVYLKDTTEVDTDKLGENPSGLKIAFTAKTGTFKGSFKAYADVNGKPNGVTVNVAGVLVDGIGYGTATIRTVGGIPFTVE